ncbi:SH3 domain-containing protein [Legionella genomosp. 1]|uniref:SH3 domain-containing protein n=1 Tax=Legionella genomosp. 1 TaxID=1093625 RepID=UPI00105635FB|nr:SH3 domain-containing protein [Legionella genomosp. 1]
MSGFALRSFALFCILAILIPVNGHAVEVPIYDFPLELYSQKVNDYLPDDSSDYDVPILSNNYQESQLERFYQHYYSSDTNGLSPWSEGLVRSLFPKIKQTELEILDEFNNQNKEPAARHYGENFKEHDAKWLNRIQRNMNLPALENLEFSEVNRAIAINNSYARALPESAPDFYHFSLPGQGFPFDNLQESAIWSGTPLYVFAYSNDKAWALVLTPDAYFAWVKSNDIALASGPFVNQWQKAAKKKLIAITKTQTEILDKTGNSQFTGYIGGVFPLVERNKQSTSVLIPAKNNHNQAVIRIGMISTNSSELMPVPASKKTISQLLIQLQNRPYGWGGAYFYNDCSQELKSLFTPLGIWLPRNSAQQGQLGSVVDLSKKNVDERLALLKEKGHPLMTLIYIGGHVMLYLGNKNTSNNESEAITYQNIWGLSPPTKDKRYVIGQSLFFPLLKYYPENTDLSSLADKGYFKLVFLDQLNNSGSPQAFAIGFSTPGRPADL